MTLTKDLSESLQAPLRSFIGELGGHIEFFKSIDFDSCSSSGEKELIRRKIEGRFHLIRGASGFFKLDSLRSLATNGEHCFQKAKGDEAKLDELLSKFLKEAITEIEVTYNQLKIELP